MDVVGTRAIFGPICLVSFLFTNVALYLILRNPSIKTETNANAHPNNLQEATPIQLSRKPIDLTEIKSETLVSVDDSSYYKSGISWGDDKHYKDLIENDGTNSQPTDSTGSQVVPTNDYEVFTDAVEIVVNDEAEPLIVSQEEGKADSLGPKVNDWEDSGKRTNLLQLNKNNSIPVEKTSGKAELKDTTRGWMTFMALFSLSFIIFTIGWAFAFKEINDQAKLNEEMESEQTYRLLEEIDEVLIA